MQFTRITARALLVAAMVGTAMPVLAQGTSGPYLAAVQAERRGDVASAARFYARALARDGGNLQIMERAMLNHLAAGNVAEGISLARRFEGLEPGHHMGVLGLAADALQDGDLDQVRDLVSNGGPFVGQVMDAWAAFEDGDLDAAREKLSALEGSEANGRQGQVVAATHLALMLSAADMDAEAVDLFQKAADMDQGGTIGTVRARAGALARVGRAEEAVAVIEERLSGTFGEPSLSRLAQDIAAGEMPAPTVRTAREGAADVLYRVSRLLARGQSRDVPLAYAQLATYLDPRRTEAKLLIAQIFGAIDQHEPAISAYEAVPADAPEALSALIGKAEVLQEAGEADAAVGSMQAAVDQFPGSLEAHTSLGDLLRRSQRFEEAAAAYDKAVDLLPEVVPQYWPLFYRRGIAFERSGVWERAEADFRLALEMEPDQPDVLNYLGYSLVEMGQKLGEAEQMIRAAVEQRPEDGYIVDSLGWVYYRFGEFERAVTHLERAVELKPVDPVINDHFGDALWMVGRKTEARFQWRRALSFDPEEKDAERIRRKLEIGLDVILAEEAEAGKPGIIGRQTENGLGQSGNDGG